MNDSPNHFLPLISVIVLTYNSGEYVRATLDSIHRQDYEGPIELLIGDDCSVDNTIEICEQWLQGHKERFIRTQIIRPEANRGVVENINACYKEAQGEWVKAIAGDDILEPFALGLFYKTASEAPEERLFLYSALRVFEHDSDISTPKSLKILQGGPGDQAIDINYIFQKPSFWTNAPSFFIARRLLEDIDYIPRLFRNVEDRPLFSKVLASGYSIYHISKPTVFYRVHSASLTSSMAGARYAECNWKTYQAIIRPCFSGLKRLDLDLRMLPYWYTIQQGKKNRKTKTFKFLCKIAWGIYRTFTVPFTCRATPIKITRKPQVTLETKVEANPDGSPLVSVLVPVYNTGQLLDKCLETLIAQTCPDIEFICINDGSTDGSGDKLDAIAAVDPRFKVIHQSNGGYGKAMNAGLDAARGSYIGIVEPDDWVEAYMFHHLITIGQKHNADVVKANYISFRQGNERPVYKIALNSQKNCVSPIELPEYLEGGPSIWTGLYKREWLHEHRIRFSETPGAAFQDLGFCIRTWIAAKTIATTCATPYHYKEDNPNSSSRRKEDGAWAAFNELKLLTDAFKAIPTEATAIRSILVKRIFITMRADYRLRIQHTVKSFLQKYSHMLNELFPLDTLDEAAFSKNEWHDLHLIYKTPLLFPRKSRSRVNWLQRLCSCRSEAGNRVLRLFGMSFVLPKK